MKKQASRGKRSIQTGNIDADIVNIAGGDIYQTIQEPRTASAFFTIDSPPADFTGRETELQQLLSTFDEAHEVLICGLTGSGGIGKTVLARLAAHKLQERFPEARLEINLLGTSPAPLDPAEAMRRLLAPFYPGVKLPDEPEALHGLYIDTFHQHKALLLLDNARDAAQVRLLLPEPPSAAIVTSRLSFSLPEKGLKPLNLRLLPGDEARQLLRKVSPRLESEPEEVLDRLAELCGCLPLALRVSASLFESRLDWSLTSFLKRLADEHARLSLLSDPDDPDLNVHLCLALSYDSLPAGLRSRFRQLAVFAAPFDLLALAAVWDDTPLSLRERGRGEGSSGNTPLSSESDSSLGQLLNRHLLEYSSETGQYALHDLTRLYALGRLCEEQVEAQQALERYAGHYLAAGRALDERYQKGGENIVPALRAFAGIWLHLSAAWRRLSGGEAGWLRFEGADRWLSDFPGLVAYVLDLYLPPRERIPMLETALQAARRLGDRGAESAPLTNLGNAWLNLGEARKASAYYEQALEVDKETGDRRSEGTDLGNLGNAWSVLGEPRKAIASYKKALKIAKKTGDRGGEGRHLGNLGNAWRELGEVPKAIEYYEQALEIDKETGDRRNEGANLGNLGIAYRNLGEVRKAIDYQEQALEIAREIGDRGGESTNLGSLGNAWSVLGEPRKAIAFYEQALEIAQETGDRRNEGIYLGNLGLAWADLGEAHKASAYYEQALEIAKEIGDRGGEGRHLANLGNAYQNLGEVNRARECYQQALKIFTAIESPNADWVRQQMAELEKSL